MTPNPQTKLNEMNDKMYGSLSENLSGIPMTVQTRPERAQSYQLNIVGFFFFINQSSENNLYISFFVGIVVDQGEGGGEHN